MRIINALLGISVLLVFLFPQAPALASQEQVNITEVYVNDTSIVILGEDLLFGQSDTEVALGEFGVLTIIGTPTNTLIEVSLPALITDGDYRLRVSGGAKIKQSDEYDLTISTAPPPQLKYQMLPVSAFQMGAADDDTWDFDHITTGGGFGWISGGSAPYDVRLYAPVVLPHGATVTELSVYYLDMTNLGDISALDLTLVYQGTGANFGMASVSVTTTGNYNQIVHQSTPTIYNPQIDASVNRVYLVLSMTVTSPNLHLRFYGARITYTEP